MTKLSVLATGFAGRTTALVCLGILSSAASATQSDITQNVAEEIGTNDSSETAPETKKITDKRHPDYVRCRNEAIIGSLAKKRKVCMTNKQWAEASKKGNRLANNMIGAIQVMSGGGSFTDGK